MVQIVADCLPKTVLALRIPELEQAVICVQQDFFRDLLPAVLRKSARRRTGHGKIVAERHLFRGIILFCLLFLFIEAVQPLNFTDKVAFARHTLQIPFGYQLLIRQIHGTPAHRQIARKRPRRRQPLPCTDPSAADFLADKTVDLLIERCLPMRIQRNRQFIHLPISLTKRTAAWDVGFIQAAALFHFKILIYFAAGSLKELFRDTIRLNTSASSLESFASTQKNPFLTNWKLSYAFASFKDGSR